MHSRASQISLFSHASFFPQLFYKNSKHLKIIYEIKEDNFEENTILQSLIPKNVLSFFTDL
jgi:hypothetical protein